jgi:hypothetical protein
MLPLLAAAAIIAAPPPVKCGTKSLYGRTYAIRVVGKRIPCSKVKTIIRGSCRTKRTWSCFSLRSPDPLLIWFKERERFKEKWTTTIEARRPPCANVTAEEWNLPGDRFPTRRQVLADDLIRCHLLLKMSRANVVTLLGEPDDQTAREVDWEIGLERDSFLQVDSEFLTITFKNDLVSKVEIAQG